MVSITGYTDPGVSIGEVNAPGSINVTASRALCLVGLAPRTKRATDEVVIRGKIYEETLDAWSASTPFSHVLVDPCNKDRTNALLYKNDNAMGYGEWSFAAAQLVGAEWGGVDIDVSVKKYLTLSVDGRPVVRIDVSAGVVAPATATDVEIVDAINNALSVTYASDYGLDYASFASSAGGVAFPIITLTSPITTSASDIKIYLSPDSTGIVDDGASEVSNTAWAPTATAGVQADTYVIVADGSYTASATYVIEYVSIESLADPLDEAATGTELQTLLRVGTYPGSSAYVLNTDYEINGDLLDWELTTSVEATVTSTIIEPYATTTLDKLYLGLNGGPVLTVTVAPAAATAAEAALLINAAFAASTDYGPEYGHTAEDAGGYLKLTCKNAFESYPVSHGSASSIVFYTGVDDMFALLFGTVAQPYEIIGVGTRPFFGSVFYTTYEYTRASTEYDLPIQVFDTSALIAQTSPLSATNYAGNDLAIGGLIAFENGAPSLWLQQINDSTAAGSPTASQIHTAIDNCAKKSGITEVLTLNTSLDTAVYQMAHISEQSSILEKQPRRGWYGMASGTDVGDPDTPGTLVYRATQTLQPGATSAGRGRQFLVGPCDIDRVLTLEDGTEVTRALDGSFLATAVAAYYTSLPGAADVLIRKTISGFVIDTFEEYTKGERKTLASQGVLVVTLDAGNFRMLDALTTEAGGGKVVHYEEPGASWQKDVVTSTVANLVDSNMVGVVPTDVADFIVDTKSWIMLGILANIESGTIGPYTTASGNIRDIDPVADIKVWQSATDDRTFYFRYWYNLRYPAKRFFGEYSVDNPFFAG